jgi:hypothetical protein
MQKREWRVVENLKGMGELKKDNQAIADVTYIISVIKEFLIADSFGSHPQPIEGIGNIKGSFRIINPQQKIKADETYTLELSDGRKIDVMTPPLIIPGSEIEIYLVKAYGFE